MRIAAIAASLLLLAAAAFAFASAPGSERELRVDLAEWSVRASGAEVAPGPVQVVQRNTGRVEHDLLIVRTKRDADDLPMGLEGVKPSLAGRIVFGTEHSHQQHDAQRGRGHHLAPGSERSDTVRLTRGTYVLLCPLPGHYEAGQRASLTVR